MSCGHRKPPAWLPACKRIKPAVAVRVDYDGADFPFDSLMKSAAEAKQFALLDDIKKSIDSIQNYFNESLKKYTIGQMLLDQNSKPMIEKQVGWYFNLLIAGKEGNHVGSYLTSEWWRRNMVIYENILKRMTGKEEKILVIFGSGHTALLQEMMKYNPHFELVPVASMLLINIAVAIVRDLLISLW